MQAVAQMHMEVAPQLGVLPEGTVTTTGYITQNSVELEGGSLLALFQAWEKPSVLLNHEKGW